MSWHPHYSPWSSLSCVLWGVCILLSDSLAVATERPARKRWRMTGYCIWTFYKESVHGEERPGRRAKGAVPKKAEGNQESEDLSWESRTDTGGSTSEADWDDLLGKGACRQAWRPEFDLQAYTVDGENWLLQVVLWPPHACCGTCSHIHRHPSKVHVVKKRKKETERKFEYRHGLIEVWVLTPLWEVSHREKPHKKLPLLRFWSWTSDL